MTLTLDFAGEKLNRLDKFESNEGAVTSRSPTFLTACFGRAPFCFPKRHGMQVLIEEPLLRHGLRLSLSLLPSIKRDL